MWGEIIGSGISALTNWFANQEAQKAQNSRDAQNRQFSHESDLRSERLYYAQENAQREFAQHGVQWRADDARAAGIHPLAAIGGAGASYSPQSVNFSSPIVDADYTKSNQIRDMGQNLSRAASALFDKHSRNMAALAQERGELENDLLRSKLALMTGTGPGLPSNSGIGNEMFGSGQGDGYGTTGKNGPPIVEKPVEKFRSSPFTPGKQAGSVDDYTYARTGRGTLAVVPSADVKQLIEDQIIPEIQWSVRNFFTPMVNKKALREPNTREHPLPKGYKSWRYQKIANEWYPSKY